MTRAIIAVGSQAVRLAFIPNDPGVVDSTGALGLVEVPKRMLILGGGIIGLEVGTVHSTLREPRCGGDDGWPDAGRHQHGRRISVCTAVGVAQVSPDKPSPDSFGANPLSHRPSVGPE